MPRSNIPGDGSGPAARGHPVFASVCLLFGLAGLGAVGAAVYGVSPGLQALAVRVGLAGAVLASGLGQVLVLLGAWLLWRGRRRT